MKKALFFTLLMLGLSAQLVLAQEAGMTAKKKTVADKSAKIKPDTQQMIKDWERAREYTKEYLDAMPEEGYAFKPTPEIRSFAEQMLHIADANYMFASLASGANSPMGESPAEKSADKSKEATIKTVMDSYDYVIKTLNEMPEERYGQTVEVFGFEMKGEQALVKAFEHQTHHRGQTTIYLRLQGQTPPNERLF
jgi:uncharacterized damage-inducible protein DinB